MNRAPDLAEIEGATVRFAMDVPKVNGAAHAHQVSATPYRWIEPSKIKPRQWLHARHYIRQFVTATVAAAGVGKSSEAKLDAVSMACGRNLLTGAAIQPVRVWYWNGEDPHEELQRRIQAIALYYELSEADFGGRLFIDSGRDTRIKVAVDDRQRGSSSTGR
jgi:RecA-family ATPase